MKQNMTLLRDLIRTDLTTMKGGKNSSMWLYGGFTLFMAVLGFLVSPLAGLYIPFLLSAFFVPMLFNNEIKYHSERLWCLLPIQRRDLVNARFILSIGLYLAFTLAFYLLMLLSMRLHLWSVMDPETPDIVSMTAERAGFTPLGFFNLCYFGTVAFGLILMAESLRKYFRDPASIRAVIGGAFGAMQKAKTTEYIFAAFIIGSIVLIALVITGILPVGPAFVLLLRLLLNLAQAADGFLLAAVFLTISGFHVAFSYVSTLIEYDNREL